MRDKNLFYFSRSVQELREAKTFDYQDMANRLAREGKEILSFGIGQPDFPTPQHIVEAAVDAIHQGFTRYVSPPGIPELRQAIADYVASRTGAADIRPEETLVTPGAKPAMFFAMVSCVKPGDEVIIPDPSFYTYTHVTRYAGGSPIFVPLQEENGFTFTAEDLQRKITPKTRMIILNSPQNPTGGMLRKSELDAILNLAKEKGIIVVSDEIYDHYVYDEAFMSVLEDPDWREYVIYVNSFSKTYAMAGWRLGYIVAPKDVIDRFALFTANTVSCTTAFVQKAGVAALRGPQDFLNNVYEEYQARRQYLYEELSRIPGIRVQKPAGAFYFFPNVKSILEKTALSTEELAITLMKRTGVVLLPGSAFPDRAGEGYLRLSYALPLPKIRSGIEKFKTGLTELEE